MLRMIPMFIVGGVALVFLIMVIRKGLQESDISSDKKRFIATAFGVVLLVPLGLVIGLNLASNSNEATEETFNHAASNAFHRYVFAMKKDFDDAVVADDVAAEVYRVTSVVPKSIPDGGLVTRRFSDFDVKSFTISSSDSSDKDWVVRLDSSKIWAYWSDKETDSFLTLYYFDDGKLVYLPDYVSRMVNDQVS